MPKTCELRPEPRQEIITLKKEWYSSREIKKIARIMVDFTVRRHQEMWQNENKRRAGRPKATAGAEDYFIKITSLHDRRLTTPNITAQLNQCCEKNMPTSTARRRHCEAGLYDTIAVNKTLSRKQNNIKRLQWSKPHKDWTIKLWNKVLMNQSSKSLGPIRGWWRVDERAATPVSLQL